MARFERYWEDVQTREGLEPRRLIRAWTEQEVDETAEALCGAIERAGLVGSTIANLRGTNQSMGNQAADHFVAQIAPHLPDNCKVLAARGSGYPDRILVLEDVGFAMELKASSRWNEKDTHRRVITCSPNKLLKLIRVGSLADPPAHLMITVLYGDGGIIGGARLDFLNPDSEITVRLEASTSQQLLSLGTHKTIVL